MTIKNYCIKQCLSSPDDLGLVFFYFFPISNFIIKTIVHDSKREESYIKIDEVIAGVKKVMHYDSTHVINPIAILQTGEKRR